MQASGGDLTYDPVTMDEIADRLKIDPGMVGALYRHDRRFPLPCWTVDGWPFWEWSDVQTWAKALQR